MSAQSEPTVLQQLLKRTTDHFTSPFLLNPYTSLPTPTVRTHEGAIPISRTVMKLSLIVVLPAYFDPRLNY
eukprot:scaffold348680_cov31-Attheya_sp.AAC.1